MKAMKHNREWSGYNYNQLQKQIALTDLAISDQTAQIKAKYKNEISDPLKRNKVTFKNAINTALTIDLAWKVFKIFKTTRKLFK